MAFINFPMSLEEEELNILSASGEGKDKGVC